MNWKLVWVVSFFFATTCLVIVFGQTAFYESEYGEFAADSATVPHSSLIRNFFIFDLLVFLVLAFMGARVIVARVTSRLFKHGAFAGLFGGIILAIELAIVLTIVLSSTLYDVDSVQTGEATGFITGIVLWIATPISALVMGTSTWLVGKIQFKRENAKLVEGS